jgi:hypothetical protein
MKVSLTEGYQFTPRHSSPKDGKIVGFTVGDSGVLFDLKCHNRMVLMELMVSKYGHQDGGDDWVHECIPISGNYLIEVMEMMEMMDT